MPAQRVLSAFLLLAAFLAAPVAAETSLVPTSPEVYRDQADRVRRSQDRPWAPTAGQLGNLRFLHIRANDCLVRIVSGNENRVFPGTREVYVVEGSRVLDDDPDEQPVPRNVTLSPDMGLACGGSGSCGISFDKVATAPRIETSGDVCFTVQLASAHDLLLGGDNLTVLFDRVRQPWLRVSVNPGASPRLWLHDIDVGSLTLKANANVRVGGTGRVEYLGAQSSNGGSAMYLHLFNAPHVGVSTTTTGTFWSMRIGDDTDAEYYQPARAPGTIAQGYRIEIDGRVDRLQVPASRVDPHPLGDATRAAARALGEDVLRSAGPTPRFPVFDASLRTAVEAVAVLPRDGRDRVIEVLSRYLPAGTRITAVQLRKAREGRVEGLAPDAAAVKDIQRLLSASGEFTYVSVNTTTAPTDKGQAFAVQMHFSCDAPGLPSVCPAGDPRASGKYSEMQVIEYLETLLGPDVTLHDSVLDGRSIHMEGHSSSEAAAKAALERIGADMALFRVSHTGIGPDRMRPVTNISAKLELVCPRPPTRDGICSVATPARDAISDGPE